MKDFIENLQWRGMLYDSTPGTANQLQTTPTAGYMGIDPTAPSLHIGSLAALMVLKHFQLAGHKPMLVIGGATGMIGDPSFKAQERKLLDKATLQHNQAGIEKQLQKFLDFNHGPTQAKILNNYDWCHKLDLLTFLRDIGKHASINTMMAKDAVKKRLQTGISFTEFTYQLLQAYDFYYLYTTKNVKLQMGGADQWGNLTAGIELIRKKANQTAFALTTPLVTKADGSKFGKTEAGNIWLDPDKTSPYQFYQFWLNITDEDAQKLIKIFTLLEKTEIDTLIHTHNAAPHKRTLQKVLAKDITLRVHATKDYDMVFKASEVLFGNAPLATLATLDESDLQAVFKGIPQATLTAAQWQNIPNIIDLVSSDTQGIIFPSKGAAKRMIEGGGLTMNKIKITDPYQKPPADLLKGKYLIVQKGKKNYYVIIKA